MEWNPYLGPRMSSWMHELENDEELIITLPVIPQPRTPNEPMEFLARSWTPSSTDITKALAQNLKKIGDNDKTNVSVTRWFHNKESTLVNGQALKRKDKARLDNAHVHTSVCIASLASGLASVTEFDKHNVSRDVDDKMKMAVASSTELMASHCFHLAELAGAEHQVLTNAVNSSVDIRSVGDLLTLNAAAATALRAEAALRTRMPDDGKKTATISPYDRCVAEDHKCYRVRDESRKHDMICTGELLQQTDHKGAMRRKHVTVYINKKSQQFCLSTAIYVEEVMMKMKNKHIGSAFSKTKKCIVYGVCDETSRWPFQRMEQEMEDVCLGLKTGKGFMEFKCRNKIHKEKWVEGIRNLLREIDSLELTTQFLDSMMIMKD